MMKPQEIIQAIDDFCESHGDNHVGIIPGYDFAHIVLADYNLEDGSIEFCLDEARIAEWVQDRIADCDPKYCDPEGAEPWQRWMYDEIIEYRDAAIGFLKFLLGIQEEERDAAMDWYWEDLP